MLITALLMTATLTGVGAPAGTGGEPDGVVATAPATSVILDATAAPAPPAASQSHGLSTDQQIAQWLAARSPVSAPYDDSPVWRDDRKPHGEVSVSLGTGGHRDYAAAVSLPLGESGRLDISVRQVENGYPYSPGYGRGYAYDPYFTDSGYAFPGNRPGAAIEYENRLARPDGPPRRWPTSRPLQSSED
jgi:hypothetical protein